MAKDCKVCHGEGIVYTDLMDLDTHSLCRACNKDDESSFEMIDNCMVSVDFDNEEWTKLVEGLTEVPPAKDNKEEEVPPAKDLFEFLQDTLEWALSEGDE